MNEEPQPPEETSKPETFLEHRYRAFNCGPAPSRQEFRDRMNGLLAEIGAAPLEGLEPIEEPETERTDSSSPKTE